MLAWTSMESWDGEECCFERGGSEETVGGWLWWMREIKDTPKCLAWVAGWLVVPLLTAVVFGGGFGDRSLIHFWKHWILGTKEPSRWRWWVSSWVARGRTQKRGLGWGPSETQQWLCQIKSLLMELTSTSNLGRQEIYRYVMSAGSKCYT